MKTNQSITTYTSIWMILKLFVVLLLSIIYLDCQCSVFAEAMVSPTLQQLREDIKHSKQHAYPHKKVKTLQSYYWERLLVTPPIASTPGELSRIAIRDSTNSEWRRSHPRSIRRRIQYPAYPDITRRRFRWTGTRPTFN